MSRFLRPRLGACKGIDDIVPRTVIEPLPEPCVSRCGVRVRFAETDLMGIAHHATYLLWFEVGRVEYMRRRGVDYVAWNARGLHLPVVEAHVSYNKTVRFDELLTIETRLGELKRASLRFDYRLLRTSVAGDELVADGYTRLAAVGDDHRIRRLPADALDVLRSPEPPSGEGPLETDGFASVFVR
jgi:acyl-CoA thioester hydrolase